MERMTKYGDVSTMARSVVIFCSIAILLSLIPIQSCCISQVRAAIPQDIVSDPNTVIQWLQDENSYIAGSAAYILSQIGGKQARDALVGYLDKCLEQGGNLTRATEAIAELPDPRAFPSLMTIIKDAVDSNRHGRALRYAAKALGKIGDSRASGPLAALLDPSVPYHASLDYLYLDAIASTKGHEALPGLLGHLEALTKRLGEYPPRETWRMMGAQYRQMRYDFGMCQKTVGCLGAICGATSQGQTYEEELQFWQDYLHQHFSVMYLPPQLDENACGILLQRFDQEHYLNKIRIIRALGETAYRPALNTLARQINCPQQRLTQETKLALKKYGKDATEAVVNSLPDAEDGYIRCQRILFILELGDNGKLDALVPYLTNSSESDDVRCAACRVLTEFHYTETMPYLIAILAEKNTGYTNLCRAVKEGLQKFGQPGVVAIVTAIEGTGNPDHRANLICALMRPNARFAIPVLTKCLQDEDLRVRRYAISGLQQVAGVDAAPKLLPLLDDPSTRRSALLALEKLARRSFNKDVKACRQWWEARLKR